MIKIETEISFPILFLFSAFQASVFTMQCRDQGVQVETSLRQRKPVLRGKYVVLKLSITYC